MEELLNIKVIKDIQKQLRILNWSVARDYRRKLLTSHLSGIEIGLFETGLTFRLVRNENDNSDYYVCVERYADYTDDWSPKTACGEIHEDEVISF
ncbi:MAG: hypothetical protein V8S74_06135 [Lachnospirales bacterium]